MTEPRPDLELARNVVATEARCIAALGDRIDDRFAAAAEAVYACAGTVVLTGIGKAGLVARKISATFASTGTPSIFLHPVEALHGDLGRVRRDDAVVALSDSGTTTELIRLTDHLKARGAKLIALVADADSPLGRYADIAVGYGKVSEACPMGLAPSASTGCMMALGDALAFTVMRMRDFSPEDFVAFHPGGALSRSLLKVEEVMTFRAGGRLPVFAETLTVREVLAAADDLHHDGAVIMDRKRRAGAVCLVDAGGRLSGIFTDGDLRRQVMADDAGDLMARPIGEVMVRDPRRVRAGELASEALAVMNRFRIDELPVVDSDGRPVGLLDVQDLVGMKALNHG